MIQLPSPVTVPIDAIAPDDPFQVRVHGLDEDHVEALVAECESGTGVLPPIVLTQRHTPSGIVYYVVDGHHEVEAQRRAGRPTVQAIIVDLNDDDAIDLAWERKRQNGRPLSVADRVAQERTRLDKLPPLLKKADDALRDRLLRLELKRVIAAEYTVAWADAQCNLYTHAARLGAMRRFGVAGSLESGPQIEERLPDIRRANLPLPEDFSQPRQAMR